TTRRSVATVHTRPTCCATPLPASASRARARRGASGYLATDRAGALSAIGFVAPHCLHGIRLTRERDVLEAIQIAGIGDRLNIFVPGDDAVTIQIAMPKGIVILVHPVTAARSASFRH